MGLREHNGTLIMIATFGVFVVALLSYFKTSREETLTHQVLRNKCSEGKLLLKIWNPNSFLYKPITSGTANTKEITISIVFNRGIKVTNGSLEHTSNGTKIAKIVCLGMNEENPCKGKDHVARFSFEGPIEKNDGFLVTIQFVEKNGIDSKPLTLESDASVSFISYDSGGWHNEPIDQDISKWNYYFLVDMGIPSAIVFLFFILCMTYLILNAIPKDLDTCKLAIKRTTRLLWGYCIIVILLVGVQFIKGPPLLLSKPPVDLLEAEYNYASNTGDSKCYEVM